MTGNMTLLEALCEAEMRIEVLETKRILEELRRWFLAASNTTNGKAAVENAENAAR